MLGLRWDLGLGGYKPKVKGTARKCLVLTISIFVELPKMMLLLSFTFYELYTLLCVLIGCAEVFKLLATQSECLELALCIKMLED